MNFLKRWAYNSTRKTAAKYFDKTPQDRTLEDYAKIFGPDILNILIKSLTTESIVLDLGAGEGRAVQQLRLLGFKTVLGIDLFAKNQPLIVGEFENLPFKPSSIDAAISCSGLGFYANGRKELLKQFEEVKRVLKPGGSLLVVFSASLNQPTKDLAIQRNGKIAYREQYLIDVNQNADAYKFEVWKHNGSQEQPKQEDQNTIYIKPVDTEKLGFLVKAVSYNYGLVSMLFTVNKEF